MGAGSVSTSVSAGKDVYRRASGSRVLLREPEVCMECSRVFISLYPIRRCREHEGLDEI